LDFIALLLIAVGLAMDAFSVAVTNGMLLGKFRWRAALKVGVFFGFFQFLMPCLGWLVSNFAADAIARFDHWIAFGLLAFIGGKMILESQKKEVEIPRDPLDNKVLALFAIATSIDALAVGVTFAAVDVAILSAAGWIGIIAFLCSAAGVWIGSRFGDVFGNKAEVAGGIILVGMGIKILIEHLF
jgi:putative Mn2+ efflux pump MntP